MGWELDGGESAESVHSPKNLSRDPKMARWTMTGCSRVPVALMYLLGVWGRFGASS